jgi:hypothetical protein
MAFRDFATGCLGHFVIGLAAAILLGGTAHYFGLSGRVVFAIVVVVIFIASVLVPDKKAKKQ